MRKISLILVFAIASFASPATPDAAAQSREITERGKACEAYALANLPKFRHGAFITRCRMGKQPVEEMGAKEQEGVQRMREDNARRFPTETVVPGAISNCERSSAMPGLPTYDCACIKGAAEGHLAAGILFNEQIRDLQFDRAACLDRKATFEKYAMYEANSPLFQRKTDGIALAKCREGLYDEALDGWLFEKVEDMRTHLFEKGCPMRKFPVGKAS
ncbi:hypothetical protein [Gimibacter soli]|uniref:DUF1311 domain-containing protein n=1 Tax=Gimibacter soli TaxID=3024400 RepID=A0AAE9XLP8_9PROT|nr:hypothetical protein [Gimibacter soli]WCL52571.1 hypothetical protein PH603_08430 [Gimibacter soli]